MSRPRRPVGDGLPEAACADTWRAHSRQPRGHDCGDGMEGGSRRLGAEAKQGVGQPANAEWQAAVWTNWGVDRGWERPRTAPTSTSAARPNTKPAEKPTGVAAALPSSRSRTARRQTPRKVNAKYADGISRPPWMAPLPDYMLAQPETPESSKGDVQGPDVYEVPMAPGTNVAVRGGSWPVKMTVPPDALRRL